jgi:subtilisin family serine protease
VLFAGAALSEPDGDCPEERARLLVALSGPLDDAGRARLSAGQARVRHEFPEISAVAIDIPSGKAEDLLRGLGAVAVEQDVPRWPLETRWQGELQPKRNNGLYGLITTGAKAAQASGATGAGATVCIADTGIDVHHPDIEPKYRGGIDTVNDDSNPDVGAEASETHGTHVAGIAIAALNGVGVRGVAYAAELYHARVIRQSGGSTSDIMAGVQHLVTQRGCKVVNLSLGGSRPSNIERQFYSDLWQRGGVIVVAAAGNEETDEVSYPAGYPEVIAVGAVDRANKHADFSNTGVGLDLSGPGVGVLSSVPRGTGRDAEVAVGPHHYSASGLEFAGTTAGITDKLIDCGTGNSASEFPAAVAGKLALIQRGEEFFSVKVENAMNAGARAAVIYDNVLDDNLGQWTLQTPRTSDGRPWIPAVGVSGKTGRALLRAAGGDATLVSIESDWEYFSGTSMAAPHVAGTAALVLAVNPALSNAEVEAILEQTAKDLGPGGYDTTFGWGLVNAKAAVLAAQP